MGLYTLLIVQPLIGWAATSAYRAPIIVYGLFELPPILPVNQPLSEQLSSFIAAWLRDGGLVLGHRRAALITTSSSATAC
jgi:cytochrome b561